MEEKTLDKILVFGLVICAIGMATTYIFSGLFFIILTFSGYGVILTTVCIMWYKNAVDTQKHYDELTRLLIGRYGCLDEPERN